jgi:hypothetical protein
VLIEQCERSFSAVDFDTRSLPFVQPNTSLVANGVTWFLTELRCDQSPPFECRRNLCWLNPMAGNIPRYLGMCQVAIISVIGAKFHSR